MDWLHDLVIKNDYMGVSHNYVHRKYISSDKRLQKGMYSKMTFV